MSYDRLFYPLKETNRRYVLINKKGIKDRDALEMEELHISGAMMVLLRKKDSFDKFDLKTLCSIHKKLFGSLYEWAGKQRIDNVSKYEDILGGDTVDYSNVLGMADDWNVMQNKLDHTNWDSLSLNEKANKLAEITAGVWKVHYFNEGNTRSSATFMELYCKRQHIKVDWNSLCVCPHEFRDNLALYCHKSKDNLELQMLKSMMNAEKGNFTAFGDEKTPCLSEADVLQLIDKLNQGKIDKNDLKDVKFECGDNQFRIKDFNPKVTILEKEGSPYAYMAKDFVKGELNLKNIEPYNKEKHSDIINGKKNAMIM